MKNKILIGRLARYFNISKQTLHHYDKVGVLNAISDEENGYRYYTYEDVDKLSLILSLKTSGLSLKQIQSYIENMPHAHRIELLEKQIDQLQEQIFALEEAKQKIEYKIKDIKREDDFDYNEKIRLEIKNDRYILRENLVNDIILGPSISLTARKLSKFINKHPEYMKYAHAQESVSLDKEQIMRGNYKGFKSAFIFIDDYKNKYKEDYLGAGLYVCKYYEGLYEDTEQAYEDIRAYIEREKLEIIGDGLEIPILTVWSIEEERKFVMEIQLPVRRALE